MLKLLSPPAPESFFRFFVFFCFFFFFGCQNGVRPGASCAWLGAIALPTLDGLSGSPTFFIETSSHNQAFKRCKPFLRETRGAD